MRSILTQLVGSLGWKRLEIYTEDLPANHKDYGQGDHNSSLGRLEDIGSMRHVCVMCVCERESVYVCVSVCMHVHSICVRVCVCVCVCVHMCVSVSVCVCVSVCIVEVTKCTFD